MFENAVIGKEYERILNQIKNDPFDQEKLICYKELIRAHFHVIDFFYSDKERIVYGVKDLNLLGSTLGRQIAGYSGIRKWKSDEEICATLFYGIIKNHAFHDANKRTALLTLLYHLLKLGRTIDAKQKEFEDLAVRIASNSLEDYPKFKTKKFQKLEDKEVYFIANFIKRNTREIEKKYYPVTFHEFGQLLKRHGFYFEVASGGAFLDVMGTSSQSAFFGLIQRKYQKRYIQVGFPGWKRQINAKAVKEILKATGLTAENGIDSKVFFKGAEPLTALIDQYRGPLVRLKDK
jgi:death-on-curing protein